MIDDMAAKKKRRPAAEAQQPRPSGLLERITVRLEPETMHAARIRVADNKVYGGGAVSIQAAIQEALELWIQIEDGEIECARVKKRGRTKAARRSRAKS